MTTAGSGELTALYVEGGGSIGTVSLTTCTIFVGSTITTIASMFIYKCRMFNATIIVVRQPSGYMMLAFHWQYVDIALAIFFTYYFVLSMKNKYTIPYHTIHQTLHLCSSNASFTTIHDNNTNMHKTFSL